VSRSRGASAGAEAEIAGTRPPVGVDVPPETVELMDEITTPPREATETLARLLGETRGAVTGLSSVAAVHEALEQLEAARHALAHADAELRILALHEEASAVFAETLSEVLGNRPLAVKDARRAALTAAAGAVWEDAVGPLLSSEQVRELANVSRQRVAQLASDGQLIVLEEQSGTRRYPAWQFGPRGRPLAPLVAAHRTLVEEGHMSGWSAASWCTHPHGELDGRSPRDWATAGEDPERLALVARRDAARSAR
jgi:hypothetical protein